jgi:hypothetical protein
MLLLCFLLVGTVRPFVTIIPFRIHVHYHDGAGVIKRQLCARHVSVTSLSILTRTSMMHTYTPATDIERCGEILSRV